MQETTISLCGFRRSWCRTWFSTTLQRRCTEPTSHLQITQSYLSQAAHRQSTHLGPSISPKSHRFRVMDFAGMPHFLCIWTTSWGSLSAGRFRDRVHRLGLLGHGRRPQTRRPGTCPGHSGRYSAWSLLQMAVHTVPQVRMTLVPFGRNSRRVATMSRASRC